MMAETGKMDGDSQLIMPEADLQSKTGSVAFGKRSRSVFNPKKLKPGPDIGLNDYIKQAFATLAKNRDSFEGIPEEEPKDSIDGVKLAQARNRIRKRLGNSKHHSSGLRLTGMDSRPIIEEKELTQEEIERNE